MENKLDWKDQLKALKERLDKVNDTSKSKNESANIPIKQSEDILTTLEKNNKS